MRKTNPRPPTNAPLSRRQLLESVAAAGLALSVGSLNPVAGGRGPAPALAPFLPKLKTMLDAVQAPVRRRAIGVAAGGLVRPADKKQDEYTFAVDVGQLLCYFARARDKEPYLALRDFAAKELIVDLKDDPFTKGFVLWRCQPGQKPDASGTTEALRLAKGLWAGSAAFGRPEDRELAVTVVEGYGRHQNVDQGLWLIRNYFHFASRAFASNSFIIDYDPDFLREVSDSQKAAAAPPGPGTGAAVPAAGGGADGPRAKALRDLADHSYEVLRASVAPCGLLYDLLQPELKTMYYGLDVAYFSPNDVIQTNNACATAATVARGAPDVAQRVLRFVSDRLDKVYAHYYGRTGEKVHAQGIGATEYCAILRLAALLGDRYVVGRCVEQAMPFWEYAVSRAETTDAWTASEMLLGLQAVLEFKG